MAEYSMTFFSTKRLRALSQAAAMTLCLKRAVHFKHNPFIRAAYRALLAARHDARFHAPGSPSPRRAKRVNGRTRSVASKLNERQARARRHKLIWRRLARDP